MNSWFDYTDEIIEAVEKWDGEYGAPTKENRKKTGLKVFANPILENVFGTSHPIMPGVWFIPVISYGLYAGITDPTVSLSVVVGLFSLGVLLWTLTEYSIHRWLFHLKHREGDFDWNFGLYMLHGYHHQFPNDKYRLVAPPVMSWPIAIVIAAVYYLTAGPHLWWPLFAGTVAGYLAYDWIHYYTHHFNPKTRLGKALKKAHMIHHFKAPEYNMGISNPLWDHVLGTYSWDKVPKDVRGKPKSPQAPAAK